MNVRVPVARRVAAPVTDSWIAKVVAAALKGAGRVGAFEVGVVFVGDAEMTRLNSTHRGKRKTTDVLSFGNDGAWLKADAGSGLLGDVVISVAQARRQAKAAKRTLRDELAMLLAHGTLHLLGYDHETVQDERIMFPLQKRILKRLGYA
jgi:probable rRNA maturation factor